MPKLKCISCNSNLPIAVLISNWQCKPCSEGKRPEDLVCSLCGRYGGLLQKLSGGWVHFLCSQLFHSHILYEWQPSSLSEVLHSTLSLVRDNLKFSRCLICNSVGSFPVLPCARCQEFVHIDCAMRRNWLIDDVFLICGCQLVQPLPHIRYPRSIKQAQGIFTQLEKLRSPAFMKESGLIVSLKIKNDEVQIYQPKKRNLQYLKKLYASNHRYFGITQIRNDLDKMIQFNLKRFPDFSNEIQDFEVASHQLLEKVQENFKKTIKKDFESAIKNNRKAPRVMPCNATEEVKRKEYFPIFNYFPVDQRTCPLSRLDTTKAVTCNGLHCDSLSSLGPLNLMTGMWTSKNSHRSLNIECSALCKCSNTKTPCQNRQIFNKSLAIGVDVAEKPTWGFDSYTYRSFLSYMCNSDDENTAHNFISNSLCKALNAVDTARFGIRNALKFITDNSYFSKTDKTYAKNLQKAIQGLSEVYDSNTVLAEFQIHSKGTGIICTKKEGIPANSLITEYFGELYSPAKWYEKQDIIKNLHAEPVDFYNIVLERHKDDPEGYDVLMVDPFVKGTYASRMNHSCSPNCATVNMITAGRYCVGMYALKPISYMEELTFDYHSFTESRSEQEKAICLCGSSVCRSYYLENSTSVVPEFYTVATRFADVIRSVERRLSPSLEGVLDSFNLKKAVLQGCPGWLKVWIALKCKFIEQERSYTEGRLQNLVMTVDKIKYCLKDQDHPPYRILGSADIMNFLWGKTGDSIRSQLLYLYADRPELAELLSEDLEDITLIRRKLLVFRDALRRMNTNLWITQGISDLLHLIAYTRLFVKEQKYESFTSNSVPIRQCEVQKNPEFPLKEIENIPPKKYNCLHIHGLLVDWYKQNVEQPGITYCSAKNGIVNLPCIRNASSELLYPQDMRNLILNNLRNHPHKGWPSRKDIYPWKSFKNSNKVLGTPMLDQEYFGDDSCGRCLDFIDTPAELCELVE